MLRRLLGVIAVVSLAALGGCEERDVAAPRFTPPKADCPRRWGEAVRIGRLPRGTKEVSGFVSSARHDGVAWMVRDSGNPTTLYSFEVVDGAVRTQEFPVPGVTNEDWEDIAYSTGEDGRGRLWILDNISRRRAPKTIYELLEPDPRGKDRSVTVAGRYRWEYPDRGGDADTEVLLALGGSLVVISKTEPSRVYRFEGPLDPVAVNRPVLLGPVREGTRLVLAATSAGDRLLLTSSTREDTAWVYELAGAGAVSDVAGVLAGDPVFSRAMRPSQREAGDFFPHGGCDIVLVSEQESVWMLPNGG